MRRSTGDSSTARQTNRVAATATVAEDEKFAAGIKGAGHCAAAFRNFLGMVGEELLFGGCGFMRLAQDFLCQFSR